MKVYTKISHLSHLPQQKVPPLAASDHLTVPELDKRFDVGDGLVVEHPAGHIHLDPARRGDDSPEVDVPIPAVHDQGEGKYLKVFPGVVEVVFDTWW